MVCPCSFRVRIAFAPLFLAASLLYAQTKPGISFTPPTWDLGAILRGSVAQMTVTVRNDAVVEAAVSFLPTCSCLSVEPSRQTIAAGASARFAIRYDSWDVLGPGKNVTVDAKSFIVRSGLPGEVAPYYFSVTASVYAMATEATTDRSSVRKTGPSTLVTIHFWRDPSCRRCDELLESLIPSMERTMGVSIATLLKDGMDPLLHAELSDYCASRGLSIRQLPALRAGEVLLQGEREIRDKLQSALRALADVR